MSKLSATLLALAIFCSASTIAAQPTQASLRGTWTGWWITQTAAMTFEVDGTGNIVSGSVPSLNASLAGNLLLGSGGQVTGTITFFNGGSMNFTANLTLSAPGDSGTPFRLRGTGTAGTAAMPMEVSGGTDGSLPPPPPPPPTVLHAPDLAVSNLQAVSAPLVAGASFVVSATLANVGTVDAGPCRIAFFLNQSAPAAVSEAAAFAEVGGLAANSTVTISAQITYPTSGDFRLALLADPDLVVSENSRINNFSSVPVRVLASGCDLVIGSVTVNTVSAGVEGSFDVTIENRGMSAAPACRLAFFANRPAAPLADSAPDQLLSVPALVGQQTLNVHVALPVQNAPRAGRAWFVVDSELTVAEALEQNNVASATWGIGNRPPEILSRISLSSSQIHAGQALSLTVVAGDPEGDPLSYEWDMGDGVTQVGAGSATHTFTAEGDYRVAVTISDGPFNQVTDVLNVHVAGKVSELGVVRLSATKGRFDLKIPVPEGFGTGARLKSKLIDGNAGASVRYRNLRLRGKTLAPGTYTFTVEFYSAKPLQNLRVSYSYTVMP